MHTFQRRFTITPLAIIRHNTLEPSQAPGGYIHRCYQTIFPGAHKVETRYSFYSRVNRGPLDRNKTKTNEMIHDYVCV